MNHDPSDPTDLVPVDGRIANNDTPTFSATFSDPDGQSGSVAYTIKTLAGATVASGSSAAVSSGSTASWTVPAGELSPGTTYQWYAQAFDSMSANSDDLGPFAYTDQYRLGTATYYTYASHQAIDDQESLSVNVGNGNLVLSANDIQLPGIAGLDLNFARTYNSLYLASQDLASSIPANGWQTLASLGIFSDGDVRYASANGLEYNFNKNSDGSYTTPDGADATLVQQGDGSYVLAFDKTGSEQAFTSAGTLTSYKDKNGNTISFNWSGSELASITDSTDRTTSFTYNASGQLTTITAPGNCDSETETCTYQYDYDSNGNLTSFTDPSYAVTSYAYDSAGFLTQITDPNLNATKIAYDASNRVSVIQRGLNSSGICPGDATCPLTTFSYSVDGGSFCGTPTTDVMAPNQQPSGPVTRYCFDSHLRVTAVQAPGGVVTSTDYTDAHGGSNCTDANGNSLDDRPCSTTSGRGYVTTYGYDSTGQKLLWEQNPVQDANHRSTWVYGDSAHPYSPTLVTDADGNPTSYTYTSAGNVDTETDGAGYTTSYTYNANGELATEQTGLLRNTETGALTCPTGTPSPICPTTAYSYDSQGNRTEKTVGLNDLNRVSTYGYDGAGNRTSETHGLTLDGSQNVVCPSGATCPVTSKTYDGMGRLLTKTGPDDQSTTIYTYDGDGNQTHKTEGLAYDSSTQTYDCPSGSTCPSTSETYDANNQLTIETAPDSTTTTYTYDPDGNQLTETDPDGNQTRYWYDSRDQQDSVQTSLGSSGACTTDNCPITSYNYDRDGNQVTETDPSGRQTQDSYNAVDQITEETSNLSYITDIADYGCATGDTCATSTFAYDPAGNEIAAIDADGTETVTAYDADNRTLTVTGDLDSSGQCPTGTCPPTSYTYDNNGNVATVTDTDLTQDQYLYNADNHVISFTAGLTASGTPPTYSCATGDFCPTTTYAYDNLGNEVAVTNDIEATTTDLSGGGELSEYALPNGTTLSVPTPPADFDPLTASDADLATYDFPARPTDPSALAEWTTAMSAFRSDGPPADSIAVASNVSLSAKPLVSKQHNYGWGGWLAGTLDAHGYTPLGSRYAGLASVVTVPTHHGSQCNTNNGLYIWIGLGGTSSTTPYDLLQEGIECGLDAAHIAGWPCDGNTVASTCANPGRYRAFLEYAVTEPPVVFCAQYSRSTGGTQGKDWILSPNDHLYENMRYVKSSQTSYFFIEDVDTGEAHGCSGSGQQPSRWVFNGSTADFVAEAISSAYSNKPKVLQFSGLSFSSNFVELDNGNLFNWLPLGSQSRTKLYDGQGWSKKRPKDWTYCMKPSPLTSDGFSVASYPGTCGLTQASG